MNPEVPAERWREIDTLFQRVLELPPDERTPFLAEAASGDDALRRSVEQLLEAAGEGADLFETPVEFADATGWQGLADFLDAGGPPPGSGDAPGRTGELVGPYRILREVGRGGMATVYLAERADGQWEQQVALKVIRRGLDTDDVVRRFLAERQILSSLEHPNICRLLDGGATGDGVPFLAMEFVDGKPITAHCDEQGLSVRERLGLFGDVCRAVQHAHQSLIVHRDLKPSNILVTTDGAPKLLDFGIAKLLDDSPDDSTQTGRQRLTPQYASPELVRGDPITTASDVYQLGVLLCVLLAGRRPYDVAVSATSARLEAQITGTAPQPPSRLVSDEAARGRGTTVDRLRRRLRGDLDAIVLKALRKEPSERYASAEALLGDIDRHLTGHPVEAARGATRYRVGKFVRRHAAGLATTAAFFVLLAVAAVALAVQRDRAVAAAETSTQVAAFLSSVFEDADPVTGVGDTMSVRTQLARGARRVQAELEGRPALQAELYGVIGRAYRNLGLLDEGIEILTVALERAREAYDPEDEELDAAITALMGAFGESRMLDQALSLHEELLEIRRRRFGPNSAEFAATLAEASGRVRDVVGPDSAEVLLRQARAIPALDPETAAGVRVSLNLAYVLRAQGKLEEAEALYREAIPLFEALSPNDPDIPVYMNNLAFLLRERGANDEAADLYREALALHAEVHGRGHPVSLMLASNLSTAFFRGERVSEGEAVMQERVSAAREQWPEGHWRLATVLREQGMANVQYGDGLMAVAAFRESVEEFAASEGERHPWTAATRLWLGAALVVVESAPEGYEQLERAVDDLEAAISGGVLDGRAEFQIGAVADYLESHGREDLAAPLRGLQEG